MQGSVPIFTSSYVLKHKILETKNVFLQLLDLSFSFQNLYKLNKMHGVSKQSNVKLP